MVPRMSAVLRGYGLLLVLAGGVAMVVAVAVIVRVVQPDAGAVVPEGEVEFDKDTYTSGATAVFFIQDSTLHTTPRCLASWTELPADAGATTTWNLISGEPYAAIHAVTGLMGNCGYDTNDPANTPLTGLDMQPSVDVYPPGALDPLPHLLDAYDPVAGTFSLQTDVSASSTVEAIFQYHVVDSYAVAARRAKVFSSSDPDGEWVGLNEIATEEDQSPSPSSGLFRGLVSLSDEANYAGSGDRKVFVHPPDTLTVEYYGADAVLVDSATAVVGLGEDEVCDCPIR